MPDDPKWGPATTYRSSPQLRRPSGGPPGPAATTRGDGRTGAARTGSAARRPAPGREAPGREGRDPRGGGRPPGGTLHDTRGERRRRRLVPLVAVLVLLGLVVYPVALGVTGYGAVQRVGEMPASVVPDSPGRTVLLIGSDSREGLSADQQVELATGSDVEGKRTDTIMLLHQPAGGGPVVLLSIPRDSYVDIPGRDASKINAAYAWGGAALLVQTVEQATGLHVDGYAETGLAGFANLVDAVGGVEMCPATAIADPKAGLDIPAGCQQMDGPTALGYARTRDFDVNGDLGRAQRQRELIAAIAGRAASPSLLINPFRAFPTAKAGGGALSVDDGAGPVDVARLALAMKAVAGGSALSLGVPVADTTRRTNAGVVVDWDEEQAAAVFTAIREDDTESLRAVADAQAAATAG